MNKITWLGHAGFLLEAGSLRIVFDPWISGNPSCPIGSPAEIAKADIVLVTHDHSDHGYDDAVTICKNTGATFVAVNELAIIAEDAGVQNVVKGNLGGDVTVQGARIHFAQAFHSCKAGSPCGFVVTLPDITIYHAGDTSLFNDMANLARAGKIDVALLPIGSTFTMGPREAAWAVELLEPRIAIPMHYGTFPPIEQDPEEFRKLVGPRAKVEVLVPGEAFRL